AVFFHDPLCQCQSEAHSRYAFRARGFGPVKSFKNMRQRLSWNADSFIRHAQLRAAAFGSYAHLNMPPVWRELDSVVEQVKDHALEPSRVSTCINIRCRSRF